MCFGLKNAPAEFARFMSENLREFLNDFVVVYFDDIIIFSENLEDHWKHVRSVLQRLKEKQINLKLKKCEFAVQETEYLGHMVNGESTSTAGHCGHRATMNFFHKDLLPLFLPPIILLMCDVKVPRYISYHMTLNH